MSEAILEIEPIESPVLESCLLTVFLTIRQARQVRLMLERMTYRDCEDLTITDYEAGELFQGLQEILNELSRQETG